MDVPANAPRTTKPWARSAQRILSSNVFSPPKRCVAPVTSSNKARGGSSATKGVKRSHQSAMRSRSLWSAPSFAAMTLSSGSMARALARGWPMERPSDVALRSSAERRSAFFSLVTTTSGGASRGDSAESVRACRAFQRRCSLSVARRGNHSAMMRRDPESGLPEETFIAIPLHDPMSRAPMTVADEICFENRLAPVFVFCR